jgi:prophage antirepressor-like protein
MTVNKIAVFQGKQIRKILLNDAWWFLVIDVAVVLTDSNMFPFMRFTMKYL